MKNNLRIYLSSVFLCAAFFHAFASAQTESAKPASSPESNDANASRQISADEDNLIHSGDLIDVDVIGSTEYDWRGALSPEGFLNGLNFTENPVYALCRTEEAVAEDVAKSYSRLLRAPRVSVKILDRSKRPISVVYGAVRKNQRLQIKRPVFLNELIVISGGFTDKASGDIRIFRPPNANCVGANSTPLETAATGAKQNVSLKPADETQYIDVKIADLLAGKTNPRILNGDVITVSEAKPIYVIGAVGVPKQIPLRAEITLSRAVDSAGGLLKDADASQVSIFRRAAAGVEAKTIIANLDEIKAGRLPDIVLQPSDVIEVTQAGREKRKFPPLLKADEIGGKPAQSLPLRIIE